MNIQFDAPDKVNGVMTITVDETDYTEQVEKELKRYRKAAKVPGFRPGTVPLSLLRKLHGTAVKMEVVTTLVSDSLHKYIKDNNIRMLGKALPSPQQVPQDLAKDSTHTFLFDIAVAPAFSVSLSGDDHYDYYKIKVDDALIDKQVDTFRSRMGHYEQKEEYAAGDMVKGTLVELTDEGAPRENGITVDDAIVMPSYLSDAEQKALFDGSTVGSTLIITPRKMYGDTELATFLKVEKDEAVQHDGAFSYTLKEVNHYAPAAIDQQLFDAVFGEGACSDEAAFRKKVAEGLAAQLSANSDYKFLRDVRTSLEERVGTLSYPDALLKRIMLSDGNAKDEEEVEKNYAESIKALTWHLIKEQLVEQHSIQIEENDIYRMAVQEAHQQFAMYGMQHVPQEYVDNYAKELLKKDNNTERFADRAVEDKLLHVLKGVVTLTEREVSLADFEQLISEK